jgi:2-keto-4-pentenoate hydratase/2-oxohepta-3-ene-1,7-dioic acid hydratase in catechol pathway
MIATFVRLKTERAIIPAILKADVYYDLSAIVSDISAEAIASGALDDVSIYGLPVVEDAVSLAAPIAGARQIAATGFNYKAHIAEFKVPTPTEPELFLKSLASLTGPFDPIRRGPNPSCKLDWEVELGIVMGREAEDIDREQARNRIFGYLCINDISDRATQIDADKQQHLVRAKSRRTYSPVGPYLVRGIDPGDLGLWTKVNGVFEQQGNTSDMLFDVYDIVAYFSRYLPLLPGDIIATGTPPGVGFGKNRFLNPGNILECGVAGLGAQRHVVVA